MNAIAQRIGKDVSFIGHEPGGMTRIYRSTRDQEPEVIGSSGEVVALWVWIRDVGEARILFAAGSIEDYERIADDGPWNGSEYRMPY